MLSSQSILGPEGRLAARLGDYEQRPQQTQMAAAIDRALADRHHLIVEAGTGVGKSFGYLVPAILFATSTATETSPAASATAAGAVDRRRRIVVSTHTINLQEQLIQKDLPFLNSVIPREFSSVLVKGRRNYVSLRRLATAVGRASTLFVNEEELDQIRQVQRWSQSTTDGTLSDLPFRPVGGVWDEAGSDTGNCLGRNCPTYKQCFYFQARHRAQRAQILVVNHALFFSDLSLRRVGASILPDYDAVIFDEAHMIEHVAGSHLGISVTYGQVQFILRKLFNDRTNKGLLVHHRLTDAQREVLKCHYLADDMFQLVDEWYHQRQSGNGRVREAGMFENPLSPALERLALQIKQYADQLSSESDRQDLIASHDRLALLAGEIEAWRMQHIEAAVYWVDSGRSRRGRLRVELHAAPIDVGPQLRTHLYDQTDTVVMTSATLAVGRAGSFDFFRSRVGLTQAETLRLGSPFDYRRQARLIVPAQMPDPNQDKDRFEDACVSMVKRYVEQTAGRAFVLFTSYDMLRRVGMKLAPWLTARDMALYSQADQVSRSDLLDRFKQNPRAVLLGTESFWQGVDVPGAALQNVIITKLPFSVPDQPLLEARLESIRQLGGNPFHDYQLPEAIIKLRQGFGRLIRTQQDTGIVVLLDPRVKTKRYGRDFLDSLPDCELVEDDLVVDASSDAPTS